MYNIKILINNEIHDGIQHVKMINIVLKNANLLAVRNIMAVGAKRHINHFLSSVTRASSVTSGMLYLVYFLENSYSGKLVNNSFKKLVNHRIKL